jgi:tetratricopeptide (TPR) repeat protein
MNWGNTLANRRRFGDALEQYAQARRVGPESYRLAGNTARASYFAGRRAEAMTLYRRAIELVEQRLAVNPNDVDARISLAAYLAKSGDRNSAIEHVNRLPPDQADPHVLLFGAVVYADLGDRDAALTWLERAARNGLVPVELQNWIELDVLKNDPRFTALLAK